MFVVRNVIIKWRPRFFVIIDKVAKLIHAATREAYDE